MSRSLRMPAASVFAVVLAVIIAACSSSATATPTPTSQPTASLGDLGGLGGLLGSGGLSGSGGVLGALGLHGDPALEAKLPSQICGAASTAMSFGSGALPASALGALGGDAGLLSGLTGTATFSMAFAGPGAQASDPCDTTFFAIQLSGGDPNNLLQEIVSDNNTNGGSSTTTSLGGKNVTVVTDSSGSKTYAYINGDTIYAVQADDDASAAAALSSLP